MKKKLFQNYNFSFEKNEKKLISTFCKQALKQMGNDNKYFAEVKAFNTILEKINSNTDTVKLTKDEKTRFAFQLKLNMDSIEKQIRNSFFIKKWMMKSLLKQYSNLYETHFKG